MRSFPSSAEVAREAELEKQELAMKRKRSAHEVRIMVASMLIMVSVCLPELEMNDLSIMKLWREPAKE